MLCPIELTKKLITFPSITPFHENSLFFLSDLLKQYQFETNIRSYGNQSITNLYASINKDSPKICFLGHIDVVPPGENWNTNPFQPYEINNKIYGRGAVDMKGGLAAMICSCINYCINNKFNGSISILITSDEEGEAEFGTKAILNDLINQGIKWDFCIVGEPTCIQEIGDTVSIGRKGSMNCDLTVFGKQGHVAYPIMNPNTIIIEILNELIHTQFNDEDEIFSQSKLQVTSIDTQNHVTNVIPTSSSAKFNIRFNPTQTEEKLVKFLQTKIKKHSNNFSLNYKLSSQPYLSKPSNFIETFKNTIQETLNIQPKFVTDGATSDARFMAKHCPVIEFGLKYETAHQINEYVNIADLQKLYNVYYNALCKLLN